MVNKSSFKNATPQKEEQFLDSFLELDSLRIFCRKIFHWCKETNNSIDINISIDPKKKGTLINMGMQKGAKMEDAEVAVTLLHKDEELVKLENIYMALQELNIESEYDFSPELEKIREKAFQIKAELYPE